LASKQYTFYYCYKTFMKTRKTTSSPTQPQIAKYAPRPKFQIAIAIMLAVLGLGSVGLNFYLIYHKNTVIVKPELAVCAGKMIEFRDQGQSLIKTLRLVNLDHESSQLEPMKARINTMIDDEKSTGRITDASVYFCKLGDGSYISINDQARYRPGSIAKIPLMIYFLSLEEQKPGILETSVLYDIPLNIQRHDTYNESDMKAGQSYKLRELMQKMIVNSDNIATSLLIARVQDGPLYQKVFKTLGLTPIDLSSAEYTITTSECSRFLGVLYNATYLNEKHSQYALDLLSKATFADGITKNLPKTLTIAHKFGEGGGTKHPEFSETSIIYQDDDPYLLTIMTKGLDTKVQAQAISEISSLIYDCVKGR